MGRGQHKWGRRQRELGFSQLSVPGSPGPGPPPPGRLALPVLTHFELYGYPRSLAGRRQRAPQQSPHAVHAPGLGPTSRTLTAEGRAWAGHRVRLSPWGPPPRPPLLSVGCVMGNPVLTQKEAPFFAFLTHFLVLLATLQRGPALGSHPAWARSRRCAAGAVGAGLAHPRGGAVTSALGGAGAGTHGVCPGPVTELAAPREGRAGGWSNQVGENVPPCLFVTALSPAI